MSKIKSVSQFEDGIWGTETPIGADASNVDVEMSDSSTKDLQTVLGNIPSAAAPIQSQINTKVTASGGNIGNTTVSSGIQNFDSSSSETSTELLDTSVRVTNATEVTSSMWTKFNRFRKRVDNKFKDVFLSSVEDVASPSDYKTYSQSALNDYFANVVGYASASDLPDATSTIAQQLSTLNNNIPINSTYVPVLIAGTKNRAMLASYDYRYGNYIWFPAAKLILWSITIKAHVSEAGEYANCTMPNPQSSYSSIATGGITIGECTMLVATTSLGTAYHDSGRGIIEDVYSTTSPQFRLTNTSGASRVFFVTKANKSTSDGDYWGWLKASGFYIYN